MSRMQKQQTASISPPNKNSTNQKNAPASQSSNSFAPKTTNAQFEGKTATAKITQEAIAEAAYFIWKERGGDPTLNWLEAERRLTTASKK